MYRRNGGTYLHKPTAAAAAAIPTKCIKVPTYRPTRLTDYTYEMYKTTYLQN